MKRIALLGAAWAAVVLFFVLPHPLNPHPGGIFHEAFSSARWEEGWPTRVAIWKTTLEMIRQNVVLGVGAGDFTYVYPSTNSELVRLDADLAVYANRWTNAAHNEVLQAWAETGIIGLGLLACLIGGALLVLIRRLREERSSNGIVLWCAALALGAWALQAQMNFPLQTPVATLALGLILSVPAAISPHLRNQPDAVLFPVEMERGGVRMTVYVRNMRVPCRLSLELMWRGAGRRIVGLVAAGLVLAVAIVGGRGLAAQMALREGKQESLPYLHPQWGVSRASAEHALESAGPVYEKALRLWPLLTDARSAWTDLLVRGEQYEEALKQNSIVRRRLDATEVYFREAWSRLNLGEDQQAAEAVAVIHNRSVDFDKNHDGIPDNLSLDPFWAAVYFQLIQRFPAQAGSSDGQND